eukprot:gene3936-6090_t
MRIPKVEAAKAAKSAAKGSPPAAAAAADKELTWSSPEAAVCVGGGDNDDNNSANNNISNHNNNNALSPMPPAPQPPTLRGKAGRLAGARGVSPCSTFAAESVTALQVAVLAGAAGSVKTLLHLGADPDGAGAGCPPPLLLAIRSRSDAAVRLLLSSGASANHANLLPPPHPPAPSRVAIAPLSAAVDVGSDAYCRWLLRKGADIEGKLTDRPPPLLAACAQQRWDVARTLLVAGATVNVFRFDGEEPGKVGPLRYAMACMKLRRSAGFLLELVERLCPAPVKSDRHALELKKADFRVIHACATQTALCNIRVLLTCCRTPAVHPGYAFDNASAHHVSDVMDVIAKYFAVVDALVFVESRPRALAVMSQLAWKKNRAEPKTRATLLAADSKSGSTAALDPVAARVPPEVTANLAPVNRRVIVIYRDEDDLRDFHCVY